MVRRSFLPIHCLALGVGCPPVLDDDGTAGDHDGSVPAGGPFVDSPELQELAGSENHNLGDAHIIGSLGVLQFGGQVTPGTPQQQGVIMDNLN